MKPTSIIRSTLAILLGLHLSSAALAAEDTLLGLPLDSQPFATKGEVVLTEAELDAYVSRVPQEHRGAFLMSNKRLGKALDDLILIRLLAHEAVKAGLLEDPIVQGSLAQSAKVLLAEKYREHYLEEYLLDDYQQPARELYLTEPELFQSHQSFDFSHILITRGRERGELQAMKAIFAIYGKLQEGADFQELVEEYSDDPNASDNSGKYTDVTADALDQNLASGLEVMKPGQISEPVLTDRGWHILRLDAVNKSETPSWQQVEERARQIARERHQTRLIETLYRDQISSAQMEIKPGAIEAMMERHGIDETDRPTSETVSEEIQDATDEG